MSKDSLDRVVIVLGMRCLCLFIPAWEKHRQSNAETYCSAVEDPLKKTRISSVRIHGITRSDGGP